MSWRMEEYLMVFLNLRLYSNFGPFDRKSMPKIPENSMLTKQMGPKTDESLAQISKLVYLNYYNCEIHSPHVDLFFISNVSFLRVFFFFFFKGAF